jgi:putative transcriptional regulator
LSEATSNEGAIIRPGTFLIASPMLQDPNFVRTVVLLCEHNDQGSMGLVVNRRSGVQLPEVLEGIAPEPLPALPLYLGGPVERQALLVLHRLEVPIPGAHPVAGGISLGGDMQAILRHAADTVEANPQIRFYAGYAGWGAGQLDAELAIGSWITCEALPEHVFDADDESLWSRVLKSLGSDYARLATMPPDPRVN